MTRSIRLLSASCLVLAACFSPNSTNETETDSGTESTTAMTATDGQTSQATMSGTTASTDSTTTATSSTSNTTTSTTTSGSTGSSDCAASLTCLDIPAGWEGPYLAELGQPGQCDDAGIAAAFVGVTPGWSEDCTCNCGSATVASCRMEFRIGGQADTCDDNDTVGDTCTSNLAGGAITCDNTANGCFQTNGEMVSFSSAQVCTDGIGNTISPGWVTGYRMCNADDAVGTPCDGGQCADASAPLCIYAEGNAEQCPADFPNRVEGSQSFSQQNVTCDCPCEDPADCSYLTWHEGGVCTGAGGDDDPACSPAMGAVEFLNDFVATPQGCEAPADLPEPEFPLAEPITACCTVAL